MGHFNIDVKRKSLGTTNLRNFAIYLISQFDKIRNLFYKKSLASYGFAFNKYIIVF